MKRMKIVQEPGMRISKIKQGKEEK